MYTLELVEETPMVPKLWLELANKDCKRLGIIIWRLQNRLARKKRFEKKLRSLLKLKGIK